MRSAALASLLLLASAAAPARADTLTLAAARDASLYQEDGSIGNGAGDYVFAGTTDDGSVRRALMAFDVAASIPAGSLVTSVTLSLYCSRAKTNDLVSVSLHRASSSWTEGTSHAGGEEGAGAAASGGDATWTHRTYPSATWSSPGGDFVAIASATTAVGRDGSRYTWSSAGMVADVQAWLDAPSADHGWLVRAGETGIRTAKRFDSGDSADASRRPILTVVFTPPPAAGACCGADATCASTTSAACSGSYRGDGTSCAAVLCSEPAGACCASDGACTLVPATVCGGTFVGTSTTCAPSPCPEPAGACCAADGSCAVLSSTSCSGTFLGASTSCAPGACPTPSGACCAPGGACALAASADCAGTFLGDGTSCSADACPVTLEPFVDPLPLPQVAVPTLGTPGDEAHYRLAIRQFSQRLHRDLPPTILWGYSDGTSAGTYPGPTIEARTGRPIQVTWENDLRDETGALRTDHVLPVDHCLHGASEGGARVVVHLHGGHVPASSDGHPEATILPGETAVYDYPNGQDAATLWYHDHAMGITRLNVYMGLAGLYLVRDEREDALDLPRGEHEIPLVVQDRSFRSDGSLVYPASWQESFFGDTNLVNGVVWPYLEVARGAYRFRLLNGSNSRTYTFALSNGAPMTLIGTDGGLLPAPVTLGAITLSPGERADVIVDFSGLAPGTEIVLLNLDPEEPSVPAVMKLIVVDRAAPSWPIPATLRSIEPLDPESAAVTRDLVLRRGDDACGASAWLINDLRFGDITERPVLGTSEVWRFVNRSGMSHPMHMHLVLFQVLDRQGFDVVDDEVVPLGDPVAPAAWEGGWKDTVDVGPNEIVRVIARFEDYVGRFPYHCHVLEHEDHEMMRQMETTSACGDGARGLPLEECDDGNTRDGDGCSATCRLEASIDGGAPDGGAQDAGPADGGTADAGPPSGGGCGCRAGAPGASAPWLVTLALLAWIARRTRARR